MIKLMAIDFIRRNTEYTKALAGMYNHHVEILRAMDIIMKENNSLKEQIESLNKQLLFYKQKYG